MIKPSYRKCQGCGKVFSRENLIKITLFEGKIYINPSKKILGRSAYVCCDEGCINTLIKKKRLFGALKFKNIEEIKAAEEALREHEAACAFSGAAGKIV